MLKKLFVIASLLFISTGALYSQSEKFVIYEGGFKDIMDHSLYLDNFWLKDGEIKADIEVYKSPTAKPYSGGYGIGDPVEFMVNDELKTFYIEDAFKLGKDEIGYVIISSIKPSFDHSYYSDAYQLAADNTYNIHDIEIRVVSITPGKALLDLKNSAYDSLLHHNRYEFNSSDTVWLGRASYIVTDISNNNISLKRLYYYIPGDPDAIPGELINAPLKLEPVQYTEGLLMIKRMYYFKSKKEVPTELKICLIRIVSDKVNGVTVARPMIDVELVEGVKIPMPFEFVKTFETEEEALTYAKNNNILYVDLSAK